MTGRSGPLGYLQGVCLVSATEHATAPHSQAAGLTAACRVWREACWQGVPDGTDEASTGPVCKLNKVLQVIRDGLPAAGADSTGGAPQLDLQIVKPHLQAIQKAA